MIDFAKPFRVCLVSPEGTLSIPLQWGSSEPCPWRFFPVQMWDEDETPIDQPWENPPEYEGPTMSGVWILDLRNLPPGWTLEELSPEQWQEVQERPHTARYDRAQQKLMSTGFASKEEDADVEVSHWVRGGVPAYRVKELSQKRERDFPSIVFTHVERWRKDPVTPFERLGAAVATASLLAATLTVTPSEEDSATTTTTSTATAALSVTRAREGR